MPSLRMGYMVLPDVLCSEIEKAKYIADIHSPILDQLVMAKFIEFGFFDLHLKKMRNIYLKRSLWRFSFHFRSRCRYAPYCNFQ